MVLVVGPGLLWTAANIVQGWQELLEDQVVGPLALRCCDDRFDFFRCIFIKADRQGICCPVLKRKGCSSDFMLMGIGGDARQARRPATSASIIVLESLGGKHWICLHSLSTICNNIQRPHPALSKSKRSAHSSKCHAHHPKPPGSPQMALPT